jgi:hypothetical protein
MNQEQFSEAVKALHAPAERQKKLADAVGKKYGAGSAQYREEFAKYARMLLAIEIPEHNLWAEFTAWLFEQGIKAGTRTKEQALKDIYDLAHDAPETKKPAWRQAYKQIKSLP